MIDQITRDQVVIAFPGLGIDDFILNKIALKFGNFEIRWYGVIIALGMVLAFLYAGYRSKEYKISTDDVLDLGLFSVIFGVIGARLYYVIMEHDMYHSFYDIVAIWNGGLAIYGGVIGGAIAVFCVATYKSKRNKNINFPKCTDIILPGVMIAQSLGRWGNFFNGEAYGGVVAENSPLYFLRMGIYPNNIYSGVRGIAYVHPTFLYESLWNVVVLSVLLFMFKKKKFSGEVGLWYVTWYGFGRMFIEGLRTDSLYVGNVRISQLIGFICFIIGLGLIITIRIKLRKQPLKVACETPESEISEENTADLISEKTAEIEENDMTEESENENGENN